jgi:hypothetical protein
MNAQGFFEIFCDVAKFGYSRDMKVEKNKSFIYSWLPPGTYHKN